MSVTSVTIAATIESPTALSKDTLAKLQGLAGVSSMIVDAADQVVECTISGGTMAEAKNVIGNIAREIPGVPIKWTAVESA